MRRIARWQYWLAAGGWGALVALLVQILPALALSGATLMFVVYGFLVVSVVLHAVLARGRFVDIGHDPDDAIIVMVPVANLWVFYRCLAQGTPSEDLHNKRVAKWQRTYGPEKIGAVSAVTRAGKVWLTALPVFLPAAMLSGLAYGGANELVVRFLVWIKPADRSALGTADEVLEALRQKSLDDVSTGTAVVAGFLVLFALIQLARRQSVTRASWIPALLAVPLGLVALALWLRGSRDLGMAVLSLPYEALDLAWSSFVGGSLAFLWLAMGDRLGKGDSLSDAWSKTMELARTRWLDVVAIHGGAQSAIWIGLQVLLPGIHYAITYSFADLAALFHPERPAYAWSTDVARGIRSRVFLTQFLAFTPYLVPSLGIAALTCGLDANAWVTAFMDPTTAPWYQHAVEGTLWMLSAALIKLSLAELYRDRVALLTTPAPVAAPAAAPDTKNPFAAPTEVRG